jgi:ring-1,2-phenylacetyl-CoA epoxidase subunit PaaA
MPRIFELGLTVPDPGLHCDEEAEVWRYTEPDWAEFLNVVRGNGPASALRLRTRRWAHEEGAWVRQALAAAARGERAPLPPTAN